MINNKHLKRTILPFIIFFGIFTRVSANQILVPMDEVQKNHLKAYGLAFWNLKNYDTEIDWLLNYRGGSFLYPWSQTVINECIIRGISYQIISDADANGILMEVKNPDANMDAVKLQKAPKIAVYTPKSAMPWDDAVTLALTYAEISFDKVYDDEVLEGKLPEYDWLHLHHEDFTGQYGKFLTQARNAWFQDQKRVLEGIAKKHGYTKVSDLRGAVAKKIWEFVHGGGYMFAMCNATDTFEIAMAAQGVDIVDRVYDGDGMDPKADEKLNYDVTFAFHDFTLVKDPYEVEFSDIDSQQSARGVTEGSDFFNLFEFSAKYDPVPTMLTQNHSSVIKGFMGQTTAFRKQFIKSEVLILAENREIGEARYIHGTAGRGFWTYYGGHDPEDYQHFVGEEPTDLNLHPNSAGYRLILNNVLFPAAKKKKMKT
jgi:hypothetical protein